VWTGARAWIEVHHPALFRSLHVRQSPAIQVPDLDLQLRIKDRGRYIYLQYN